MARYSASANPRRGPAFAPAGAIVRQSVQAPSARQDSPLGKRLRCSQCHIEYEIAHGAAAHCPLCDVEQRLAETQKALAMETNKNQLLTDRLKRVSADNDIAEAMRQAVDLLDERDMIFLKQVIYRWRAAPTLRLTVIHADHTYGRRRVAVANGFLLMERGQEPETHECSSVGGASIAGDYENACKIWSNVKAMELLMRTLVAQLSGRTE